MFLTLERSTKQTVLHVDFGGFPLGDSKVFQIIMFLLIFQDNVIFTLRKTLPCKCQNVMEKMFGNICINSAVNGKPTESQDVGIL